MTPLLSDASRRMAVPVALAVCVVLGSIGCVTQDSLAPLQDLVVPFAWPAPEYDEFYPYYVELCALSQYRPKEGAEGGAPGHGVMYLKGACLDRSRGYPRLQRCPRISTDELDPANGTGISVNRWFSNVNWVGVPGKHLFYNGEVPPWEVLDQAASDRAVASAIELGVFDGLEFESPSGEEVELEEFVRTESLGTDFGLRFGRTLFCARVPVEATQLDAMIQFLNEQNREYAEGEATYNWSGYSDNCVHLVHNALAAASIWKPVSVRQTKLKQLFNLAIPANEFIDLADRSLLFPIDDFRKVWRDGAQHEALLTHDWLSTRHGAMVMTAPPHQENDLYDTRLRLLVLQGPFGSSATKKASLLMSDARATDLEANLQYFRALYEAILADKVTSEDEFFPNLGSFDSSRRLYYQNIESELAQVKAHLALLRESMKRTYGPGIGEPAPDRRRSSRSLAPPLPARLEHRDPRFRRGIQIKRSTRTLESASSRAVRAGRAARRAEQRRAVDVETGRELDRAPLDTSATMEVVRIPASSETSTRTWRRCRA